MIRVRKLNEEQDEVRGAMVRAGLQRDALRRRPAAGGKLKEINSAPGVPDGKPDPSVKQQKQSRPWYRKR
jgi:hypothetical protein